MANCILKCSADGNCELWGPQGRLGTLDLDDVRAFAKNVLKMRDFEEVTTATVGAAGKRFQRLVTATAQSESVSERRAMDLVIATAEGQELWEQKRSEEIAEDRRLRKALLNR
jgi:hypothetical protein